MPLLVSIQVGQPTAYDAPGAVDGQPRAWATAFFKTPVSGSVLVTRLGVAGDGQADTVNHGGVDKAVLAYSADHYSYWRQQLSLPEMPLGGFGENLSIEGSQESTVCLGDQWRAGDVLLEVSQPRQPCWKMSRRWQLPNLAAQVQANGRSGWYLRVLSEGALEAGMELELIRRPHPSWTVARANRLMHHEKDNLAGAAQLAALPELAAAWKESLQKRIAKRAL
jgi:MOSC domain-containing protein YiiM